MYCVRKIFLIVFLNLFYKIEIKKQLHHFKREHNLLMVHKLIYITANFSWYINVCSFLAKCLNLYVKLLYREADLKSTPPK